MLKKATTTSDPMRILLLCDPAVWEAQLEAARREVDEEIEKAEGLELLDKVVHVLRSTTKTHVEMIESLAALKGSARELFEFFLSGEAEIAEANKKLDDAMADEDTRIALAFTRAHGIASAYRESSNPEHLIDQDPEGASRVTIKALSRAELKAAERSVGPRPSLGAVLSGKGLDIARRAVRQAEDSTEAYARYLTGLTADEQAEIQRFEDWTESLDREIFRRAVYEVEGFDLERDKDGYPVELFTNTCADAEDVITEAARHARQMGALDPKVDWPSSWLSGTQGSESEAVA